MKLLEINWDPSPGQLRQFALTALLVLPSVAWLSTSESSLSALWSREQAFRWDWGNTTLVVALAAGGMLLVAMSWLVPRAVRPVFVAASLLTLPIGLVIGEVLLALMYWGVFTPLGLLFRLFGRDPLRCKLDRQATSYWQADTTPRDPARYFRQY